MFSRFRPPRRVRNYFFLTVILLFSNGCLKDKFNFDNLSTEAGINPSVHAPLAYGTLSIRDLIREEDESVYYRDDGSIHIITRDDSVFTFRVEDFIDIPDQEGISTNLELQPARIDIDTIETTATLNEMLVYFDPELANLFNSLNGQFNFFPEIDVYNVGSYEFNIIENIEYIVFSDGLTYITITNYLPIDIQHIGISIKNAEDPNAPLIGNLNFFNLAPGTSATDSIDLTDAYVENRINVNIDHLHINGSSNQLYINLSDFLHFSLSARNVSVIQGKAYIPSQTLLSKEEIFNFDFAVDEQISYMRLKSAKLNYTAHLNTNEYLIISLASPMAIINGEPLDLAFSTLGSGGNISGLWELLNAEFFLDSDTLHPYNLFPLTYQVEFFSSGEMVEFDLSNQFTRVLDLSLSDIEFEFMQGYFGQKTIEINNEIFNLEIELLDKITGVNELANSEIRLFYSQSYGFPVDLDIDLKSPTTSGIKYLGFDQIVSVSAAVNVGEFMYDTLIINETNSDIAQFIAARPTTTFIVGNAVSNPSGQITHNNFIHADSWFNAGFEFETPLELSHFDIVMLDTFNIKLDSFLHENIENMVLRLLVENGFPFTVNVDLTLYDSINLANIHTFSNIALMEAAPVNEQGIVQGQRPETIAEVVFPAHVVSELDRVKHIILTARIITPGQGQTFVKLLSSYSLDFKINGKLRLDL